MTKWSALHAFLDEVHRRHDRGEISASVVEEVHAMYAPAGRD